MPVFLEPRDVTEELEGFGSVLIVSCPVCPPMSLAMQEKQPFIEFFKHGLKTKVFEDYIAAIRASLEQRGVSTDVFTMRLPSPLMCLWPVLVTSRCAPRRFGSGWTSRSTVSGGRTFNVAFAIAFMRMAWKTWQPVPFRASWAE